MVIGLSHSGQNCYTASRPAQELLVGTRDGVVLLERTDHADWRISHRALEQRHISALVPVPTEGLVLAGAFSGGLHASQDGGRTWEPRDAGLPTADIFSVAAISTSHGVRLYAGTEPAHLFVSEDLGHHWTELPGLRMVPSVDAWWFPAPPHVAHTKFISAAAHDPETLYVCIEQGALLRSTDAGQHWDELTIPASSRDHHRSDVFYDCHKLVVDPRDSDSLIVSGGAGLYVTHDSGGHWERRMAPGWATDVYPDGLVRHPRQPDLLFVAAATHNPSTWRTSHFAGGAIYRSRDGGLSWERLTNGLPDELSDEFGALSLVDWGTGCSLYAATTGGAVYGSDDGGDHWGLLAEGMQPIAKRGHDQLLAAVGAA